MSTHPPHAPRGRTRRAGGRSGRGLVGRFLIVVAFAALASLGLVVAWSGYLALQVHRDITLPATAGDTAVGRVTTQWTDPSRTDPYGPDPTRRTVAEWVWYPPASTDGVSRAAYAPGAWAEAVAPMPVSWFVTSTGSVHTRSYDGAPPRSGRAPLVVLLPGLGFAVPRYQALAESLAAQGYVVVAPTPTGSSATVLDGQVVAGDLKAQLGDLAAGESELEAGAALQESWVADAHFAARHTADLPGGLGAHIDPESVVYVGHSFGGAAAIAACATDDACAGAVNLDGYQFGDVVDHGLAVPYLLVGATGSCSAGLCTPAPGDAAFDDLTAERERVERLIGNSTGTGWVAEVADTGHLNFTDLGLLRVLRPLRFLFELDSGGTRAQATTTALVGGFVAHAFAGVEEPPLAELPAGLRLERAGTQP